MIRETSLAGIGSDYNPLDSPMLEDPYPFYERMRRDEPVAFSPAFGLWLVSRYSDVIAALKTPLRFSSKDVFSPPSELPAEVLSILNDAGYMSRCPLIGDDPPLHTRIRAVFARAFAPARVAAMEPRIRTIAGELVDQIAREPGKADVARKLAYPLPMRVIGELVGIAPEDADRVTHWCDSETMLFAGPLPREKHIAAARDVAAYRLFLRGIIEDRMRQPKEDIMTTLVQAGLAGDSQLSTDEIVALACAVVFAGHHTAKNLIGNALLLLSQEGEWETLVKNRSCIPNAIEEVLRFDSPVQGMMRTATEEVELSNIKIPKGARVMLLFGSGNRDKDMFADPDRFDIRREGAERHLGFGHGVHFCIGAQLARIEARVALEILTERFPRLRLTPGEPRIYLPNLMNRGPERLIMQWD